ncbi:hypothetical protein C0991_010341 [Blastosporella zonata]|nr:hypothetical protein C0991_010341 [Blastosporella zonata]
MALSDFDLIKALGKGRCGRVFLAIDRASGSQVAIKVIQKGEDRDAWAKSEQTIHRSLNKCQFSIPLLASWDDSVNHYLVTPYFAGNDLAINLGAAGKFSEARTRFYTSELVIALEELKAEHVLHRDIKPSNIVLTPQGHVRLLDFGYATHVQPAEITFHAEPTASFGYFRLPDPDFTATERVGTAAFMSAAMHLGQPYSFDGDYHGLGVTMYRMLTGRVPFGNDAKTNDEVMEAVVCEQVVFRPEDNLSKEAQGLKAPGGARGSNGPPLLLWRASPSMLPIIDQEADCYHFRSRWDRVRAQKTSAPWKPFIQPIPKKISECSVEEGLPCSSDSYLSPELAALRARETTLNKIAKFFRASPPPPPLVLAPVVANQPTAEAVPSSPPASPHPSCPPLPAVITTIAPQAPSSLVGGPLPKAVQDGLRRRREAAAKARSVPALVITAPEHTVQEAEPVLQDVTNSGRMLSPEDAFSRSAWVPDVVEPKGPVIKLSAPPKRRKREQKENAVPPIEVKSSTKPKPSRTPLAPISKSIQAQATSPPRAPWGSRLPPTPPSEPKVKVAKRKSKPAVVPKEVIHRQATRPAPETPKAGRPKQYLRLQSNVKPGWMITARGATPLTAIPAKPTVKIERPRAPAPDFPVTPSPASCVNAAMVAGRVKDTGALDTAVQFEAFVGIAEALSNPGTPHFKTTADMARPALKFSSAPEACGNLTASSHAFSMEACAGFYGLTLPRVSLKPEDLKANAIVIAEQARSRATGNASVYSSSVGSSLSIKVGPHYGGQLPETSPQGVKYDIRRWWLRVTMAIDRALAWIQEYMK